MENSRALPARYYRDPAVALEEMEMDHLGCRACTKLGRVFSRMVCTDQRNERQEGVPRIGHRCKWFDERR